MKKERVVWVDYTKALAIFLVVLGHSGIKGSYIECWIYGLHMPLFMLLSGYFSDKSKGLFDSIKSDFFSLVVPYYFFSLLLIPFMWFVEAMGGGTWIYAKAYRPHYPITKTIVGRCLSLWPNLVFRSAIY